MAIQTPDTDTRQAYQAKIQAELDKLNAQIEVYQAKAKQAKADTAAKYQQQVEELLHKRDAVTAKFQEVQSASEAAWRDMRQGLETAWHDLSQAVEKAAHQFQS